MKKLLLISISVLITVTSCELIKDDSDPNIFFKIGENLEYKFNDINLYDSSAHILYFKTTHEEFKDIRDESFTFLENGDTIYSGTFYSGYLSYIPLGPIILSPPHMYGDYALRIEIWRDDQPDRRNNPRIIELLKEHDLLHSGLSGIIDSLEINGTQLTFMFTVSNMDQNDLLILDLDKIGLNLFHYFTNGLNISDRNAHELVFSSNIEHQQPDPWNSFNIEWLSLLKSGDSRQFTINYTMESPLNPGEYFAFFEFPGLAYQVTLDNLNQGNNRIWLGDIRLTKEIIYK